VALYSQSRWLHLQFAYSEGRLTNTSYITLRGIETQLGAKGYALDIFIDIEEAFNSTSKSIKEVMIKRKIPEALWIGHRI